MSLANEASLGRGALAKVSWRLLPLLGLGYGVAYMDRVNISFAAARMNADLHFTDTVYGLGGGLFFLAYALLEIPSNLVLARVGARRWISRIMITWGVLAVGMMFVRTPMQFYVMRFLLGAAEAGFFPGAVFYLMHWFPAAWRGRAISRFYVAYPLSNVFMGVVAGALLGLHGRLGLSGWQWLFLVEGLPAIVLSVVFLVWLPDAPETVAWLSPGEKAWIAAGLAADRAAVGREPDPGLRATLLSPIVIGMGLVNLLYLGSAYAFNLSAPILLGQTTRLDVTAVGYLVAAGGLLGGLAMLANSWSSDLRRERHLHVAIPLIIEGAAAGLWSGLPDRPDRRRRRGHGVLADPQRPPLWAFRRRRRGGHQHHRHDGLVPGPLRLGGPQGAHGRLCDRRHAPAHDVLHRGGHRPVAVVESPARGRPLSEAAAGGRLSGGETS
jgi:ACS family tartrate transporter-like MFS transporter